MIEEKKLPSREELTVDRHKAEDEISRILTALVNKHNIKEIRLDIDNVVRRVNGDCAITAGIEIRL